VVYDGVSDKYASNVALANYFEASDHSGKNPAAFQADFSRPYYEAYCLDDAEEILAHLVLSVREWNEEAEFDRNGDPDTTGTESGFQFGPRAIDDLTDWKTLTPDDTSYPALPIAD
jgi:hypothetical protein